MRTEEEQIEAIKNWWHKHGRSLLVTIIIAVAGVLGWNYFQSEQQKHNQQASAYYQRLLENSSGLELDETQMANARQDAYTLKSQYTDTRYAQYASLILARLAVVENNFTLAEQELRWSIDRMGEDDELYALTNIRLADVLLGQDRAEEALLLLPQQEDQWQGIRSALRGDIYVSQNQEAQARKAYEDAIAYNQSQGADVSLLELKLANLTVP